ncbi:hypothetical protein ABZ467_18320 [Streptomyces sp. NPDC005727]|uniref:hypothetical protein n=1 Tax=Streptomyces sp. NPDC005727 TaxID=3157053 RepID=UPI0033D56456
MTSAPPKKEGAASEPAMPRYQWDTRLRALAAAGRNARLRLHPRLTVAGWLGDVDTAGQIADKLVDNAVRHDKPFSDGHVVLRPHELPDTEELHIEVGDADPAFPDFDADTTAPRPENGGLLWVKVYGGCLSWRLNHDDDGRVVGKTVTVIVRPSGEKELA